MFYETFSFYLASYIIFYIRIRFSYRQPVHRLDSALPRHDALLHKFLIKLLSLCAATAIAIPHSPFRPSHFFSVVLSLYTLCAAQKFITAFLADSWRSWQEAQLYIPITYISNTYRQYGRDNNWLQARPLALAPAPCPHPLWVAADATLALPYNKFFVSGSVWRRSLVSLGCLNLICNSAGIPCRQRYWELCVGMGVYWVPNVTSLLLKSYSSYILNFFMYRVLFHLKISWNIL